MSITTSVEVPTSPAATPLPGVSEETARKAEVAAASMRLGRSIGLISDKYNKMDEVHRNIAGSVLLKKTGLKIDSKERNFRVVVGILIGKYPGEIARIESCVNEIVSVIQKDETGEYNAIINMLDDPAAPASAVNIASPFPSSVITPGSPGSTTSDDPKSDVTVSKKRKKKEDSLEIEPLAVKAPEAVPSITPNPSDPMSGLVSAVASALTPIFTKIASNQARIEIGAAASAPFASLSKAIKEVESKASTAASAPASTVDEASVKKIVTDEIAERSGKGIHSIIEAEGAGILSKLLDKAADAVIASGPKTDPSTSVLMAVVPDTDSNYHWTSDLKEVSELIQMASLKSPQNTLIVGPTGAGKTDFAEQFAAKYKRKFIKMDCANLREPREWFGIKGASGGATYFKKSQFWHAVMEGGCVILLDEFNRAPDSIRNPLMPLLDHTRRSYVDEVGETLVVGPRTVFFATQNEGLEYTGTHATDRAMKSRFVRRVEIDYLGEREEANVLANKTGIGEEDAKKLVEIARTIRTKASSMSGGLSDTVSTRQIIHAAHDFVLNGPRTFKHSIFSHFSTDGGANSDRAQVVNMFQLKGFKI